MAVRRRVPLRTLQPSQLYVSADKLGAVLAAWTDPDSSEPLPARAYCDRLVLTDGHTRALAAWRAGLDTVSVVDDEDDLDDQAYARCVAWCLAEGVRTVADLDGRVVDAEAYERLWLARCRHLHADLARARRETR